MTKAIDRIKQKFEEDPLQVILVGAIAVTATAKIIDSMSAAQGRRAYAKDVNRRVNGN